MDSENSSNDPIVREERGDSIYLDISTEAYLAIEKLSDQQAWGIVYGRWMPPEYLLLLIERLKYARDDEDIFPKGKWATIQQLQECFERGFWKYEEKTP